MGLQLSFLYNAPAHAHPSESFNHPRCREATNHDDQMLAQKAQVVVHVEVVMMMTMAVLSPIQLGVSSQITR